MASTIPLTYFSSGANPKLDKALVELPEFVL